MGCDVISEYARTLALSFLLNGNGTGRPAAWGIGLSTTLPASASFDEASGGGYARQTVSFPDPIASDIVSIAGPWTFQVNPAQTFAGFALFDATSSGNVLDWDTFASAKTRNKLILKNIRVAIGAGDDGRNAFSLFAENILLNYIFKGVGSPPPVCAVGISTNVPQPSVNHPNEIVDSSYAS
jgi:hypothetical protein